MKRLKAQRHGSAIAIPVPIMTRASRAMSHTAEPLVAPSAIRIPISCVRCAATNEITPYRPTTDRRRAITPKPLDIVSIVAQGSAAEAFDHSDDFNCRASVGAVAEAKAVADRTAIPKISSCEGLANDNRTISSFGALRFALSRSSKLRPAAGRAQCHSCHSQAKDRDYVFSALRK